MYCIIYNKLDQGSSTLQSELLKQLRGLGRQGKISKVCPISMHFYSSSPAIMRVSVSPAKLESSCLCVAPAPFKVIPRASNSPLS